MKPIQELLSYLSKLDVKLWLEGERLRCNAPKGVITKEIQTELSERKAEIINLLQASRFNKQNLDLIPCVPRDGKTPLSFSQQRLWFLDQLEGKSANYNISSALHLRGQVELAVLERAFREIVRRHEVLRTIFTSTDGSPVQIIKSDLDFSISVIDLEEYGEREKLDKARLLATEAGQYTFDLSQGPLWKVTLLRLDEQSHILVFNTHHIISDGWSIGILIRELSILYQAFYSGNSSPLPELPIQYTDFAHWQREHLKGDLLENKLSYWHKQLAGIPPLLELPTDRPRPPVQTFKGGRVLMTFNTELTEQIKVLGQKSGATLFMTLLAAFVVLLSRYSGQKDIVVGSPIANRNRKEIESLIGFFVNTLVLRVALQDNPSFDTLLTQVKQVALDAYAHQDVPFEQLVETLQPERNLSHSPLFQVMFVLQNAPIGALELPGLSLTPLEQETTMAKFDLTLFIEETEQGLQGQWEYNSDLFDQETIKRMSGHFKTLLEGILRTPQENIGQLPLLTAPEKHKLLVEWNNTQSTYPRHKCIHQLFEEQVEKTPDALAVIFEEEQLTYRQLNARANQLAHYLQSLGVGAEVLVGICVERSIEMIVGLLGILKAGGAYVPLDPDYPQQRLAYILQDSQVPILLVQQKCLVTLPEYRRKVICLNSEGEIISQQSEENLPCNTKAKNLAYLMYTSGSTGKPKGVSIIHQGVVRLVKGSNYIDLGDEQRFLQLAPLAFDASTFEIWGPLLNGGRLIVFAPRKPSLNDLGQVIKDYGITTLWLTAGLFHLMVDEQLEDLKSLRQLLAGGDVLSLFHVHKCLKTLKHCRLINGYGPTENTTFTCTYEIQKTNHHNVSIPIGRPIANTQVYILDQYLNPTPIGVPGELYIGGDGLARGYFNRPDLTAKKFISNPFNEKSKSCLYKSGDLARYLSNGQIEFLGRIDTQVKIRGFRIELGEIETVLNQASQVLESVVIVREDQPGNKCLVAYLVPNQESIHLNKLRQYLSQKLPDYMMPSAFVELEAMPLTPNGKVDRKSLPAPYLSDRIQEKGFVAPRTPTEKIISAIWAEVLGVQQISIQDNFFEMGGHSLLATQVVSRVRKTFSIELPLRQLFASPTLAELANFIDIIGDKNHSMKLEVIESVSREIELPLSFAQERLWFLNQLEGSNSTYNMSIGAYLSGSLNIAALENAFQEIVCRHEVLRTSFTIVDGSPVQIIDPNAYLDFLLIDLQSLTQTEQRVEVQRLSSENSQEPFDLSQSPLVRARLLQLKEDSFVLLFSMHHIVSDGWSMGIFMHELSSLYQALCKGESSPLPKLPIQYADFAHWQRHHFVGETLAKQLNYWKKQLVGIPPLLELPTDRPRPLKQTFRGGTIPIEIEVDLTKKLKTLSQKASATLFMTLLTTFAILMSRYSRQEDIVIGSPIANRNQRELESLIGFFVNTLVLRVQLQNNPSFEEVLKQTRQMALEGYAHQDIPFERLVEALQPERNLSHSPLFQVMFVLQNTPTEALELPGLTVTPVEEASLIAKFDLTLSLEESDLGLRGSWEYNSDLFDATTIKRMSGHFQTLLAEVVANPQERVAQLPMLTATEQKQLLVEWNDTQTAYPKDKCIHQLFEDQVKKTPDALAVVFEEEQLTYRELNYHANQLANHLQSLGVGPEVLVGICVKRSIEMVVGLLGILKAGGAYVPLDSTYPKERLAYMLSDSQVSVLLTQQSLIKKLPEHQAEIICLNENWQTSAYEFSNNPDSGVAPQNLCYIIYTSGSTGKPKGTMVVHRGMVNYLTWCTKMYKVADGEGSPVNSSISFDATITSLFSPLLVGRKVLLLPEEKEIESLKAILYSDHQLSLVKITPAHLVILSHLLADNEAQVQTQAFIIGGEALLEGVASFWQKQAPHTRLINEYGPTETVVGCCIYEVSKNTFPGGNIPIGRPIANTNLYILDHYLQAVPIGVPGELYIGGVGLARGYLNRPHLTEQKFISNPFSDDPNSRLYKTGDLARYLPDGNIEYMGRLDNQVKIRGFRIELGEIESVLNQHPEVREAVVIAREDQPGNKCLVAYLVLHQEAENLCNWRQFLATMLPDYMIPSAFMVLDSIPLTPNGKVNRRVLPQPNEYIIDASDNFIAPRDALEQQLTQIWAEVLNVSSIGVQDNFFDLGGHSFLAVRLMAYIEEQFGKNLPLAMLFQKQTIEDLADYLRSEINSLPWSPLVAIQSEGSKRPFFCIPGVGGNVLYFYELAHHFYADRPFYGLQALGLDGKSEPYSQVEEIAAYYVQAIKTVQPQGPYFLGGHSFGGYVAFEMAQQLQKQGQEVAILVILDCPAPFLDKQNPDIDGDKEEIMWLIDVAKVLGKSLVISDEAMQLLNADEKLTYLKECLQEIDLLPPQCEMSQVRGVVNVFRANRKADANYFPQNIYPTKIALFRASEALQENSLNSELSTLLQEPNWGWTSFSSGSIENFTVPGNHMSMMGQPHVKVLAERLKVCLNNYDLTE